MVGLLLYGSDLWFVLGTLLLRSYCLDLMVRLRCITLCLMLLVLVFMVMIFAFCLISVTLNVEVFKLLCMLLVRCGFG